MKATSSFAALCVFLFGLVMVVGCGQQPVVTIDDETTVTETPAQEEEVVISMEEIVFDNAADMVGGMTTGDAPVLGAGTTGDAAPFNLDQTTGEAPIVPVTIEVIEDNETETTAFFF